MSLTSKSKMNLTSKLTGDIMTIWVDGRVDSVNASFFRTEVLRHAREADVNVVLDLSELRYLSSAGIGALIVIARDIRARELAVSLCRLSEPVRLTLELSGVDTIIPTASTHEEAVASFSS